MQNDNKMFLKLRVGDVPSTVAQLCGILVIVMMLHSFGARILQFAAEGPERNSALDVACGSSCAPRSGIPAAVKNPVVNAIVTVALL